MSGCLNVFSSLVVGFFYNKTPLQDICLILALSCIMPHRLIICKMPMANAWVALKIDECLFMQLGSGTDPVEGGCLAAVLLEWLLARARLTFCTSHHADLKELSVCLSDLQLT